MLQKAAGTDVETAPAFDRNWNRMQFVLQFVLALMLCAALAGVFGGGWLSTSRVRAGPFEVTYERFARKTVPFPITLRSVEPVHGDKVQLTIGRALVDRVGIARTIPAAVSSADSADGIDYVFAIAPGGSNEIIIAVQPDRFGIFNWTIKAAGLGEASLFQIIYP